MSQTTIDRLLELQAQIMQAKTAGFDHPDEASEFLSDLEYDLSNIIESLRKQKRSLAYLVGEL